MAEERNEAYDTTIEEEETISTDQKIAEAKEAGAQAVAAAKNATKKSVDAAGSAVKDTAKKAATRTRKAATKTRTAAKETAAATKKAMQDVTQPTTKRKYTRKPTKTVMVQYGGKEVDTDDLAMRAMAQLAASEPDVTVKKIAVYVKPEESAAYYVINDQYTGRVEF